MTAAQTTTPSRAARRRERQGVVLCIASTSGFAAIVIAAKLAYSDGANAITLLTVRFAIAAPVLWLLVARRAAARDGLRRDALVMLLLGGGLYSAETGLVYSALARLNASLVELLLFVYPALVMLGALALRLEAPSRGRLFALVIATSGVALVLTGSAAGMLDPLGAALALGGALLYACYILLVSGMGGQMHPIVLSACVCTGAAVALGASASASGSLHLGMGPAAWGLNVAIALTTVVALSAFVGGVARVGPSRASILATMEPVLVYVLAVLIFDDRLTPLQAGGGALVVAAAVALQLRPRRWQPKPPPGSTPHL
jgi:drug/metabolite transporter (DMT)-like permease